MSTLPPSHTSPSRGTQAAIVDAVTETLEAYAVHPEAQ